MLHWSFTWILMRELYERFLRFTAKIFRRMVAKQPRTGYNPIEDFCGKPQKSSIGGVAHGNKKRSLPEYTYQQEA